MKPIIETIAALTLLFIIVSCAQDKNVEPEPEIFVIKEKFSPKKVEVKWYNSSRNVELFQNRDDWCESPSVILNINYLDPDHTSLCNSGLCDTSESSRGEFIYTNEYMECIDPTGEKLGKSTHPTGNTSRSIHLQFPDYSDTWIVIPYNIDVQNISPRFAGTFFGDHYLLVNSIDRNGLELMFYTKRKNCYPNIDAQSSYSESINLFEQIDKVKHAMKFHLPETSHRVNWWYGISEIDLEGNMNNFSINSRYDADFFNYTSCYPPQETSDINDLVWN